MVKRRPSNRLRWAGTVGVRCERMAVRRVVRVCGIGRRGGGLGCLGLALDFGLEVGFVVEAARSSLARVWVRDERVERRVE